MNAVRRIAVVGSDLCGLACALACARAGLAVTVFDAGSPQVVAPSHVDVVPNLLRDLVRLGLADECVRGGFAYAGAVVVDESGRRRFEWPTPRLAGDRHPLALGMAYDELYRIVKNAALAAGVEVKLFHKVSVSDAQQPRLALADGSVVDADLVLLSATAAPEAMARQFGDVLADVAEVRWCHLLMPRPPRLDQATWMFGEHGRRLLLVPVNLRQASLSVAVPADQQPQSLAALVELLGGWGEMPRQLAGSLSGPTAGVMPAPLRCTPVSGLLPTPWAQGGVLLVGTAGHGVSSLFGQATSQAFEDALVLGDLLSAPRSREELQAAYLARRLPRARRVHALTRRATRWLVRPEPATDWMVLAGELQSLLATPA